MLFRSGQIPRIILHRLLYNILGSPESSKYPILFRFEVLAYSATDLGLKRIKKHPCRPEVYYVQPCPTIDTVFPGAVAQRMKEVCIKYDPRGHDPIESLGHMGIGALLAFAHGGSQQFAAYISQEE